ncbi:NAD(P)H-dependent oxidoreductase [Staphylococcus caeli]|uniref:NAD(P)H-dependent oxidoreductase n=1 Tax=Staphylococcus caeli TaxID=2201815 RepID=UPI003F543E27
MISVIYGGNQSGVCYDVYQNVIQKLPENKIYNINLQQTDMAFFLSNGYHTPLTPQQENMVHQIEDSTTLIFIYPLYWFNVPAVLKSFIDQTFWPERAFSFKKKQYFKKGLWKGKKVIIIYTQGGPEIFHKLKGNLGYKVMKYPLNLFGIYDISVLHVDNLNRSNTTPEKVNKDVQTVTAKVEKLLGL